MKRSASLRLTLMAASLPIALAACDEPAPTPPAAAAYEAPAPVPMPVDVPAATGDIDCNSAEAMATDQCKLALESAVEQAPRFLTREECVDITASECVQLEQLGGGQWMPTLMGFAGGYILAEALDEIGDAAFKRRTRSSPYRDYYRSRPVYPVPRSSPGYSRQQAALPPPAPTRAITASRSGFGSTATARSSFGG